MGDLEKKEFAATMAEPDKKEVSVSLAEEEPDKRRLLRTDSSMQRQFAAIIHDAQREYSEARGEQLTDYMSPPMKTVEDLLNVVGKRGMTGVNTI